MVDITLTSPDYATMAADLYAIYPEIVDADGQLITAGQTYCAHYIGEYPDLPGVWLLLRFVGEDGLPERLAAYTAAGLAGKQTRIAQNTEQKPPITWA